MNIFCFENILISSILFWFFPWSEKDFSFFQEWDLSVLFPVKKLLVQSKTVLFSPNLYKNSIVNGDRLSKVDDMTDEQYELICRCWCQNPKERIEIEEVIKELEKL